MWYMRENRWTLLHDCMNLEEWWGKPGNVGFRGIGSVVNVVDSQYRDGDIWRGVLKQV
jgi:hypothetical protein